jgi:hypothetical protein
MKNKKILRALSVLIAVVLVFSLTESIIRSGQDLSIEAELVGPQVVGQNPIEGQRLTLDSTIEITFDRDMDQAKTSDAFSLLSATVPVSGKVTWANARILVFTPDEPLTPSTEYTAIINTGAAALDETTFDEDVELEFTTIDALAVSQVFPAADTTEVDLNASITVIFNHPIVPLKIEEEQSGLPQPLKFSPAVKGSGQWVNSSVYVFQPEENLLSGTSYQVRVDTGLKDTNGNALGESYSWQFNTRQPIINSYYLKNGEYNPTTEVSDVPLDQVFVVEFAQPMVQASVEAATKIVDRETEKSFAVNFEWNDEFTTLVIEPKSNFKLSGFYELTMDAAAKAVDGGNLREGVDLNFTTVPYPYIASVYPLPDSKPSDFQSYIQIEFASNMDFKTMKGRVQITPAPASELDMYFNQYDKSLYIYGLDPATEYIVRILPGIADVYGNTIKDGMSYQFTNGDLSPYARLVLPWTPLVYRANGPQDVYFEHLNLEDANISVYPITAFDFYQLTSGNISNTEFEPAENPIREWKVTSEEKNVNFYEHFDFTEKDKPLEAGYYFIGLTAKNLYTESKYYMGYVFMVATDNLTFKATLTEGLAWVTDLESGTPRSGVDVTFYDEYFAEIGKAKTDKDGLAYLDNINGAQYAVADSGKHLAFTSLYWGSGVSPYDLGIYENYYGGGAELFGYLYTDRPVYRPNQDVYFKGIVRQNDDLHYSLPGEKQVYFVVEQWGEKIYSDYVNVNEQGSFSGFVHLADGVSLGSYAISAYRTASQSEGAFASVAFSIAEYRKPEFEVNVTPDKSDALPGETVNFGLDTAYYSGGNVKDAQVEWFIQTNTFHFTPVPKYGEYSFSDWDRDVYYSPTNSNKNETIKQGEGVTDESGHLDIVQTLDFGDDNYGRTVQFYANVTDVAGNTVSGGTSMVMHESELYAGIKPESYVGQVGEPSNFSMVVLDWDSAPVAGQTITVKFVERQWFSVQKKDEQGQLRWETSVKETPAGSVNAVTGEDGTAQASFTPSKGGVYKAVVIVRDSKGNTHQASTYTWVAGSDYIPWRRTNDRSFELIADKDMYSPGDTAEILIAQPFEGKVYALVTYERGHIYKQEVIQLEGSSTIYELPITDELAPIAYISVTVIGGTEVGGGSPDFKIGMARINIDTTEKTLNVTVTADKESAGPGDEVTYTVTTKDINGKPVSADVSLAVVDKAALALAPSNSPPMLSSFYPIRGLSVMTSLGLISSADEYNENYIKTIPDGARMGGGGGGEPGVITVRENFKDTAAFEAHVVTDKNGRAQVTITLPENLTTWHADVRAVTLDSRVGEAEHELISTKPLFIQMQTPRFFVVGDQAVVGAIIHNNTDQAMNVTASLDAEGVKIESEAQQGILVNAKQQAYVTWDVVVDENTQRVDLTATATSGTFTDASKPPLGTLPNQGIPVLNFVVNEMVGTSGMITSANSATELIQLPGTYNFTDASLNIEMAPSLAASMESGLTYLEDYEYLCMEQTISRFLPNVITTRALELAGIKTSALAINLDQQVNTALQRIYAKQKFDGGWNWWDGEESDPQTSAYVVYGLIEAKESGYEVSETVLYNGIDYLKNHLPSLQRNEPSWVFNRHAFMLYVLARAGELAPAQTNLIFEYHQSLDLYGKAYLAQTMYLLDTKDTRIDTLMSDLETAAILSSSGTHWEETSKDYWNWNSDTRTTAIVLNAFTQINPKSPITANAVRWLMAHRQGSHWYSTQETAWSLIALTNWLVASKEYETDYKYAIGLNDELVKEGQATRENLTETIDLKIELKDLLTEQANSIVFTRGRGDGNLYYTTYLTATLPAEEVEPLDQGMTISREYFTLDDAKTPITEIEKGELVKVRLTMVLPSAMHYIVIDDPLPAGLEAVDSSLATDVVVPQTYSAKDYSTRGWGWWYFSHIELRDEKVVLSTDYLPAGTYVYTYLARASNVGTYKVIPPTASEFYFPDVGGRGAGSVFVVK